MPERDFSALVKSRVASRNNVPGKHRADDVGADATTRDANPLTRTPDDAGISESNFDVNAARRAQVDSPSETQDTQSRRSTPLAPAQEGAAEAPEAGEADSAQKKPRGPSGTPYDRHRDVAAQIRARRNRDANPDTSGTEGALETPAMTQDQRSQRPDSQPRQDDAGQAPAGDDSRVFKLKVNGQEMEVGENQLISMGQQYIASDMRYNRIVERDRESARLRDELTQQLNEVKQTLAQLKSGQLPAQAPDDGQGRTRQPPAQGRQTTAQPADDIDENLVKGFVSKVALGDEEEATADLTSLLRRMRTAQTRAGNDPDAGPPNREELVRDVLNAIHVDRERQQVLETLQNDYQDVFEDPLLSWASFKVMGDIALNELMENARHGLVTPVTEQMMRAASENPSLAVKWVNDIRAATARVPEEYQPVLSSPEELAFRAASHVSEHYGKPLRQAKQPPAQGANQQNSTASRQDRKAGEIPQPRRASMVQPAAPEATVKSRSDIIAETRARRGQGRAA